MRQSLLSFLLSSHILLTLLILRRHPVQSLQTPTPTPPPPPPKSTGLSRRDAILIGCGTGLYGKLVKDALSRIGEIRPPEHETRVSRTFRRAIAEARRQTPNNDPNPPLRVLEVGIGGECRTVLRGFYDSAIDDLVSASSSEGGYCGGMELVGVDLDDLPKEIVLLRARDAIRNRVAMMANDDDDDDDDGALTKRRGEWTFDVLRGDVCSSIPFPDGHFDAITCCFALCSVSDQTVALNEIRRLLKPRGGAFGWVEHVAVRDDVDAGRDLLDWQQRVFDPLQQVVAHNCHLRRSTDLAILEAFGVGRTADGATLVEQERFFVDDMWPVSCQSRGVVLT